MQAKANFGEPVPFQVKVDAATEATLGASLSLDGPAESFTAGPAGGGQCKKLLGVSELVAILRRRDASPADHLGIAALLHHPRKVTPASRPERDTGLRVNQNRHPVGERPGRGQRGWARIGHELHPTQRRDGVTTGFSAPAMPTRGPFTRLAEVSGDADCDRSLSPRSDD